MFVPNRPARTAFTLVELIVSITVLLMTVLIFAQAIGGISTAWRGAEERMNNHTKARALLSRLRTDIDSMVLRPDLAAFPDTDDFGFYTLRRGVDGATGSDARSLSFVNYDFQSDSSRLLRRDSGFTYNESDDLLLGESPIPVGGIVDPTSLPNRGEAPDESADVALADGVLAFEWAFLRHDGKYSPTLDYVADGKSHTAKGIAVAMLVMDDAAVRGFEIAHYRISDLIGDLDCDEPLDNGGSGDDQWNPKEKWNDQLGLVPDAGADVAKKYPAQFLRGIRAFERMYVFPTTN